MSDSSICVDSFDLIIWLKQTVERRQENFFPRAFLAVKSARFFEMGKDFPKRGRGLKFSRQSSRRVSFFRTIAEGGWFSAADGTHTVPRSCGFYFMGQ